MKKIMLLSFALISLCSAKQAHSQSCETGKDPFSGEPVQIFDYKQHSIYYENKSSVMKLELNLDYVGELNVRIPAGAEISIKFDNDEIIKLVSVNEASPKTQAIAAGYSVMILTKYAYIFNLDKDQLEKLATTKAALIRYPDAKGGYIDYEVKGARGAKYVKALQKGAKCMTGKK